MDSGIIKDPLSIDQHQKLNYASACEDCTHFDPERIYCTFGFPTHPFLKATQMQDMNSQEHIAFCRAIELD